MLISFYKQTENFWNISRNFIMSSSSPSQMRHSLSLPLLPESRTSAWDERFDFMARVTAGESTAYWLFQRVSLWKSCSITRWKIKMLELYVHFTLFVAFLADVLAPADAFESLKIDADLPPPPEDLLFDLDDNLPPLPSPSDEKLVSFSFFNLWF